MKVIHLGHSSVLIEATQRILIDPFAYPFWFKADLVFITHNHFDHTFLLDRVQHEKTRVLKLRPGQVYEENDIRAEAVPARGPLHPRGVGYLLDIEGKRLFHSGDTVVLNEHKQIKAHVAMLNIDFNYGMNEAEALCLAKDMGAEHFIPLHWGHLPESPRWPKLTEEEWGLEREVVL